MPNQDGAEEAIKTLNESEVKGRNIRVNEANPREEHPKCRDRY